jgi:hypothetical protein
MQDLQGGHGSGPPLVVAAGATTSGQLPVRYRQQLRQGQGLGGRGAQSPLQLTARLATKQTHE